MLDVAFAQVVILLQLLLMKGHIAGIFQTLIFSSFGNIFLFA